MAVKEIAIANQNTLLQVQEAVNNTEARTVGTDSVVRSTINAVDNLATVVGTATPEVSTIMAALKILIDRPTGGDSGGSGIKQILHGTQAGSNTANITITLPEEVNPDMCLVILNGTRTSYRPTQNAPTIYVRVPSLVAKTSTSITVTASSYQDNSGTYPVSFSWQVIEYHRKDA